MILRMIISGGQSGADLGGLDAAKQCGIITGGWAPKDFMTENGVKPNLAEDYNLKEHGVGYKARTLANVRDSDGTIRIAHNFDSPGSVCTLNAIEQCKKPYYDVSVHARQEPEKVAQWIIDNNIEVLNVAGNRESKCPGIHEYTVNYLTEVLKCLE